MPEAVLVITGFTAGSVFTYICLLILDSRKYGRLGDGNQDLLQVRGDKDGRVVRSGSEDERRPRDDMQALLELGAVASDEW